MRKTRKMTSDEPSSDEAQPLDPNAAAGEIGENDLAWPIPEIMMVPLALIYSAAMVVSFGFDWLLVSLVPFAIFLAVMTVIDLRELRIPNKLTRPAQLVAIPLLLLSMLSSTPDLSLARAAIGAAAMMAFYFITLMIYPPGMGWGDVKLAPIIGAQLGLLGTIPLVRGLFLAFFINAPIGLLLLVLRKANRKTGLPFGPFMGIGAIVALVLEGFLI